MSAPHAFVGKEGGKDGIGEQVVVAINTSEEGREQALMQDVGYCNTLPSLFMSLSSVSY